jgi:2-phosphosulfolactate phosphatase
MYYDQSPFECRVEWGQRGAREAAERGDITIIVDVLSFSSTVVTATIHGASISPYPPPINDAAKLYAQEIGADLVWSRADAEKYGGHSLSPLSFKPDDSAKKFVFCSMNGAACTWVAKKVPALLIGCLLNASAVAEVANQLKISTGANITVIPCGEKWLDCLENENKLRPAIEDYLGAGSILSKLNGTKSPEAQVCIGSFEHSQKKLKELIWDCGSGRELRQRGYEEDVKYCSQFDIYQAVPLLVENQFKNAFEFTKNFKIKD